MTSLKKKSWWHLKGTDYEHEVVFMDDVKEAVFRSNNNLLDLNNDIQLYLLNEISENKLQEKLTLRLSKHIEIFGFEGK